MARQCTQPKRPKNASWYKEKAMLAEAQESGQILDEEQLAFLADPSIPDDIISEVPHHEPYHTDMDNQSVRAMQDFGKRFVPQQELSDEQAFWLQTLHPNTDQSASSPVKIKAPRQLPKELLVYVRDTCPNAIKHREKKVAVTPMNKVKKVRFSKPLTSSSNIKQVIQIVLWYLDFGCSKHMTGNRYQLMNFVSQFMGTVQFRNDQVAKIMGYGDYQLGNEKEAKNIDKEIALEKKVKELDNIVCKMEEELSDEKSFRLQTSHPNTDQSAFPPIKFESPWELPKKGNGGLNTLKLFF
nr:integrase, catalytic region, zinc finger, CCHC-type, peptidase aspartic, catalytic [Tanacetum cinerariifolium]